MRGPSSQVPGDRRRTAYTLALVAGPRGQTKAADDERIDGQGRAEHADRRPGLDEPHPPPRPEVAPVGANEAGADQVREPHAPAFVMIINGIVAIDTITSRT